MEGLKSYALAKAILELPETGFWKPDLAPRIRFVHAKREVPLMGSNRMDLCGGLYAIELWHTHIKEHDVGLESHNFRHGL